MSSAARLDVIPESPPTPAAVAATPRARSATRCRAIAALVIGGVVIFHLIYLTWRCPLDLAGDEAYYWEWSRNLDLSYYSKGPATAALIRASCAIFGDTMPAVRIPAVIMRAGVAILTYWLALRLFRKEPLALLATLISYLVPMFLAAGLIMTTDPGYLFWWACATCLAATAIWDDRRFAWIGVGLAVGIGTLTKFSMPLWLIGLFGFLLSSREHRHHLRTPWPWLAIAIAALCTTPVLIWNSQHNWVTFLHVGEDVGARAGQFRWTNLLDFWEGQLGVIGPIFLIVAAAVLSAIFNRVSENRESRRFLLCLGLPVFLAVFITSFRANPAGNWTAAAYFTFFILTADFLLRLRENQPKWRSWRWLIYPCAATGLAAIIVAHHTQVLYPLATSLKLSPVKLDPTERIKGWAEVGRIISDRRDSISSSALILAEDYQLASELAFYMRGQPKTYCAGSYFTGKHREPFSQYDIWPNRRLDDPTLRGQSAIYIGTMSDELRNAFARIEPLPLCEVSRGGTVIRRLECYACYDFRGLTWPGWNGKYNKKSLSPHVLLLPRIGESKDYLMRRTTPLHRYILGLQSFPQ